MDGLHLMELMELAPFNGTDGTTIMGEIEVAFLVIYLVGMYFVGHLGMVMARIGKSILFFCGYVFLFNTLF